MNGENREANSVILEGRERIVAEQNRGASLTMWIGLGAILCLLLTCFLGSLGFFRNSLQFTLAFLALLLIASVLIFFVPAKKDERWYVVCSLLNHGGIGLAALLLLNTLSLEIRVRSLFLSGLPAAAILFGVVMFYLSGDEESRPKLLYFGLAALIAVCIAAVVKYFDDHTEFWLCMAICALMSCAGLGALIWANMDTTHRSIYKALAAASFSVYLLVLAAAAVALYLSAAGSNSNSDRNGKRKSFGGKGGSDRRSGSGTLLGDLFGTGARTRTVTRRPVYFPTYLWYYTPYTRYASINRMEGLSKEEREAYCSIYRRRRKILLAIVVVIVVALIAFAVLAGRS